MKEDKKRQEEQKIEEQKMADGQRIIGELRKVFASINDTQRQDLHRKLMEGYCPTCAGSIRGTQCWSCFDSRYGE